MTTNRPRLKVASFLFGLRNFKAGFRVSCFIAPFIKPIRFAESLGGLLKKKDIYGSAICTFM